MEYTELADFLRKRREALQPEDLGLSRGQRRRTPGLRREEVAALASMSADYYSRLEGGKGPQPSEPMLTAIARALHLTLDERDHLFLLAGHGIPARSSRSDHVNPGLLRILDRLDDTPAVVLNRLSETLVQTRAHVALEGDQSGYTGLERSAVYRWFTDEAARSFYHEDERANHARVLVSKLRTAHAVDGPTSRAGAVVRALSEQSADFRALWDGHEVGFLHGKPKRFRHPTVGDLELHCQMLFDNDQQQALLVFTATPGSESDEKLRLLTVVGGQRLTHQDR
ncbi:helix-turn-helix transcriptional regulator [Umezawaea sp. Da 62-37]|uniref:helix-turn-helix transcriptional regulator n=1 Tax=Umezawaea sp. Da 62-37 TaxID=3075927 RepID=UPI0028F72F83|nr:helix-turn-helix transcriptional regulator [Umezawaea sp. Da 62-37]WNV88308.1 helix-turn-helix transcriptional regulator [Umezawaea sp. Da 62-37]